MTKRLDEYQIKIINEIYDIGEYPMIVSSFNNELDCVWFRNTKDCIKFQSSIIVKGLEPNLSNDDRGRHDSLYFDMSVEVAEKLVKDLQHTLKLRKRLKK